jgi:hypothetical protein
MEGGCVETREIRNCISEERAREIRAFYTEGRVGLVSFDGVNSLDTETLREFDGRLRRILLSDDVCMSGWRPDSITRDDGGAPGERTVVRRLRMEVHFGELFYREMVSLLNDYFEGTDRRFVGKSTLQCLRWRFYGLEEVFLRECDAEGRPVVFSSDDGEVEEVFEVSLGVEEKEQGGSCVDVSFTDVRGGSADDVCCRMVETFIGLCRYRGILSMNLVRDARLFLMSSDLP